MLCYVFVMKNTMAICHKLMSTNMLSAFLMNYVMLENTQTCNKQNLELFSNSMSQKVPFSTTMCNVILKGYLFIMLLL